MESEINFVLNPVSTKVYGDSYMYRYKFLCKDIPEQILSNTDFDCSKIEICNEYEDDVVLKLKIKIGGVSSRLYKKNNHYSLCKDQFPARILSTHNQYSSFILTSKKPVDGIKLFFNLPKYRKECYEKRSTKRFKIKIKLNREDGHWNEVEFEERLVHLVYPYWKPSPQDSSQIPEPRD